MQYTWRTWFWEYGLEVGAFAALALWPLLYFPYYSHSSLGQHLLCVLLPVLLAWFMLAAWFRLLYPRRQDLPEYQEYHIHQQRVRDILDGNLDGFTQYYPPKYRENGKVYKDTPHRRWTIRRR